MFKWDTEINPETGMRRVVRVAEPYNIQLEPPPKDSEPQVPLTGQQIWEWRKEKGWSQSKLAQLSHTSRALVSAVETGTRSAPDTLRLLAAVLGHSQRTESDENVQS